MVVRMLPIFLTTIFYWTIYSQVLHLGLMHPCPSILKSYLLALWVH